jgi:hypothetical protein
MPSDLTKPGALAFESIPVKANDPQAYAAPSVKRELARIYKRDGCHHCGTYPQQLRHYVCSGSMCATIEALRMLRQYVCSSLSITKAAVEVASNPVLLELYLLDR